MLKMTLNLEHVDMKAGAVVARRLAPPSGRQGALTNLEVLVLVFVAIAHMSFQLPRVEET